MVLFAAELVFAKPTKLPVKLPLLLPLAVITALPAVLALAKLTLPSVAVIRTFDPAVAALTKERNPLGPTLKFCVTPELLTMPVPLRVS
jgi:hypothetical protein